MVTEESIQLIYCSICTCEFFTAVAQLVEYTPGVREVGVRSKNATALSRENSPR